MLQESSVSKEKIFIRAATFFIKYSSFSGKYFYRKTANVLILSQ